MNVYKDVESPTFELAIFIKVVKIHPHDKKINSIQIEIVDRTKPAGTTVWRNIKHHFFISSGVYSIFETKQSLFASKIKMFGNWNKYQLRRYKSKQISSEFELCI